MTTQPSGVLNLDKPRGITSHDAVAAVRRLTGIRRVGHAGTLDPLATGVLLICVGAATRIVEYLQASRKTYEVEIRLGESTDTYDADGKVLSVRPLPAAIETLLPAALAPFCGEILQTPPLYSALKRGGRPLYDLARAGEEIELAPRPVTIHRLTLRGWQAPELRLEVECSPGTYIRSLAHDLGEALGCGGHVRALRRTASGDWRSTNAVTLDTLMAAGEAWPQYMTEIAAALNVLPKVTLPAELAQRFVLGQRLLLDALPDQLPEPSDVKVLDPGERLLGVGRLTAAIPPSTGALLSPHKVLA